MTDQSADRPQPGQKTALVTGVGIGGIGGSLATELHKAGYFVFCAVRRPSAITSLIKPGMVAVQLDVSSTEAVNAAADIVSGLTSNGLDVLINNAGTATHLPAMDLDVDNTVSHMFDVNVLGPMRMTKGFGKLLIQAKGSIVNIGSVSPIAPLVYSPAYSATKAALHAYADSLYMEMRPFGVSVVTVITGGVKSNIVKEAAPSLPENSLYRPVEQFWLRRVNQSQSNGMETDQYAASVVKMIQRKNKPLWFWSGGSSLLVHVLYYILPRWARLRYMSWRHGLDFLGKQVAARKS